MKIKNFPSFRRRFTQIRKQDAMSNFCGVRNHFDGWMGRMTMISQHFWWIFYRVHVSCLLTLITHDEFSLPSSSLLFPPGGNTVWWSRVQTFRERERENPYERLTKLKAKRLNKHWVEMIYALLFWCETEGVNENIFEPLHVRGIMWRKLISSTTAKTLAPFFWQHK